LNRGERGLDGLPLAGFETRDRARGVARHSVEVLLRDALRVVRVLGMVETPRNEDDARAVAYRAREAAIRLERSATSCAGCSRRAGRSSGLPQKLRYGYAATCT
jgi:hypothetical protein